MMYTNLELLIILDTCVSEADVKRTTYWLRKTMEWTNNTKQFSFLREASIIKFSKLIK